VYQEGQFVCRKCFGEFTGTVTTFWGRTYTPELCPSCKAAEEAERERAELERQRKEFLARLRRDANIPKRFRGPDLATANLSPAIAEKARQFVDGEISGLFLTGIPGSGKTHLACAIAHALLEKGIGVSFRPVPELLFSIRASYEGDGEREGRIIEACQQIPVLILDDMGAEKASEFSLERLYLVVDSRYREMKPLIVTSNLSLDGIAQKLHDRLASRLVEMCEIVKHPDVDRRLQVAEAAR
jgi:DNA replication protein DnaC